MIKTRDFMKRPPKKFVYVLKIFAGDKVYFKIGRADDIHDRIKNKDINHILVDRIEILRIFKNKMVHFYHNNPQSEYNIPMDEWHDIEHCLKLHLYSTFIEPFKGEYYDDHKDFMFRINEAVRGLRHSMGVDLVRVA